jgi:hypothetical protein
MKIIAPILTVILTIQLIVPSRCFTQQRPEDNVEQLREEIARLEEADKNPELSAEVRALNREFLAARKRQLNATVSKRISDLRQYLTTMEGVLKPEERRIVETTIQSLSTQLRGPEVEVVAKADPVVESRPDPVAFNSVKANVPLIGPSIIVPQARNIFSAPAIVPIPVMQGGGDGSTAKRKDLEINTPATEVPEPLKVENGTVVTVRGKKSFEDVCVVATKREELAPEPNPLAALLKIVIGLGPIALGEEKTPTCKTEVGQGVVIPADPEAKRIEAELKALNLRVVAGIINVNEATTNYSSLGDKITAFTSCKEVRLDKSKPVLEAILDDKGKPVLDATGKNAKVKYVLDPICGTAGDFNRAKGTIKKQVEAVLVNPLPVLDSIEVEMATLKKALTDGYKKTEVAGEAAWITDVSNRLDCNANRLNQIKKELASLQSSRELFESFLKLLNLHITDATYKRELIADANAKVTGTVTCTNYFTKQPSFDLIPFTITYEGFSRHSLSAGILFTTLNKRQLGLNSVRTGTAADGTATSILTFTETDKANSQIVPFSFYNYRFWGDRKFSLNGSGGVGINPNNGATQVEYFFGGAVGFHNVFLQFGGHVGRWQELGGGFNLGDTVPAAIPVPIERRYTIHPAVGVSYKLPLP